MSCTYYGTGTKVDQEKLANFKLATTSYQEVISSLGTPDRTADKSDGGRRIIYSHATATLRAATFIPIIGAAAGGYDIQTEVVWFDFDKNNILTDFSGSKRNACSAPNRVLDSTTASSTYCGN